MKLSDFDFELPDDLIATRPAVPRVAARLLHAEGGTIADRQVTDLLTVLGPKDHLVLNDTKVIPARLFGIRNREGSPGASIEVTLTEPAADGWWALIKPLRKVRDGEVISFSPEFSATLAERGNGQARLVFNLTGEDFDAALAEAGAMPLPPYIAAKRPADAQDFDDYQTVFARETGAVAAPTASLHFDEALLAGLRAKGVGFTTVTLHVGAGTFLPVKTDDISEHKMHAERGIVTAKAAAEINAAKADGRRIIPVGTTALRLIETAGTSGQMMPYSDATDIFITPGFSFQIAQGLMTNFHLPKSTLMMLVSALMGPEKIRDIYAHAIAARYRFFSYGDSSLLIP